MRGLLIAMSEKRQALLDEDPDLMHELLEACLTERVQGLLDLDKSWHALDVLLSSEGEDALLGDAVLGRRGLSFGPQLAYGRGKLIAPARVAEIAEALDALDEDVITKRYPRLAAREVHGGYGRRATEPETTEEREELTQKVVALRDLYRTAAKRGDAMLAVVT